MPQSEALIEYQKLVNLKASKDSTDILANAGQDHAAIAMSKLFDKTETIVKMVVGSFDGAISEKSNYLESLESCINRGVKFEIIFLEPRNTTSTAYNYLLRSKKAGRDITFKDASVGFVKQLTAKDGQEKHFSVYDDNKFRFEKDTKNYLAWFSFNDPDKASQLITIFDSELNTQVA